MLALPRLALDVSDSQAVEAAITGHCPVAVINCAAQSSIEAAESDPEGAWRANALGPRLLAEACARAGIPLIHISTDYVFGAAPSRPWREADPVSPVNAYGRTKAEGERAVLDSPGLACVARVAWVFGDGEDFIARLLRRAGDGPVRAADDQIGSPTPIRPLAQRLIALAGRMTAGEPGLPRILHLSGGPPVSRADWVEAALVALRRAGRPAPRLERVSMDAFPSIAARPRSSALDNALSAELFGSALDWRPHIASPEAFPP